MVCQQTVPIDPPHLIMLWIDPFIFVLSATDPHENS